MSDHPTCPDCGVLEGEYHIFLCDQEICRHGEQLISCEHCDFRSRPPKRRFPFIWYPLLCARCGVHDPDFFAVPDSEWERYVSPDKRHEILCKPCYDAIAVLIDTHHPRPQTPPVPQRNESSFALEADV